MVIRERVVAPPQIPLRQAAAVVVPSLLFVDIAGPRTGMQGQDSNVVAPAQHFSAELEGRQRLARDDEIGVVVDVQELPFAGLTIPDLRKDVSVATKPIERKRPGPNRDSGCAGDRAEDLHKVGAVAISLAGDPLVGRLQISLDGAAQEPRARGEQVPANGHRPVPVGRHLSELQALCHFDKGRIRGAVVYQKIRRHARRCPVTVGVSRRIEYQ